MGRSRLGLNKHKLSILGGLILATTNGWKKEIIVLKKRQVWTVPVAQLPTSTS